MTYKVSGTIHVWAYDLTLFQRHKSISVKGKRYILLLGCMHSGTFSTRRFNTKSWMQTNMRFEWAVICSWWRWEGDKKVLLRVGLWTILGLDQPRRLALVSLCNDLIPLKTKTFSIPYQTWLQWWMKRSHQSEIPSDMQRFICSWQNLPQGLNKGLPANFTLE